MGFWWNIKNAVVTVAAFLGLTSNEVCYDGLGCFSNKAPFNNVAGLLPQSPADMQVEFLLYTRQNKAVSQIISANADVLSGSHLSTNRKSVFIIHGYRDNAKEAWVLAMKDALLTQADVNVVSVDWERGADQINYNQAAANTRVVGALIEQLLVLMKGHQSLALADVHLVGHSLGAQIAGYVGRDVKSIGRITGLDPSGLSFESDPEEVRLDPGDAMFVDVIHTDAEPLIEGGFGAKIPLGHVDFYPNGGKDQPGCPTGNVANHLFKLITSKFASFVSGIACDHTRSVDYFTESITSSCRFTSSLCADYDAFKLGDCPCSTSKCASMGYYAASTDTHGKYFLTTANTSLFCIN